MALTQPLVDCLFDYLRTEPFDYALTGEVALALHSTRPYRFDVIEIAVPSISSSDIKKLSVSLFQRCGVSLKTKGRTVYSAEKPVVVFTVSERFGQLERVEIEGVDLFSLDSLAFLYPDHGVIHTLMLRADQCRPSKPSRKRFVCYNCIDVKEYRPDKK